MKKIYIYYICGWSVQMESFHGCVARAWPQCHTMLTNLWVVRVSHFKFSGARKLLNNANKHLFLTLLHVENVLNTPYSNFGDNMFDIWAEINGNKIVDPPLQKSCLRLHFFYRHLQINQSNIFCIQSFIYYWAVEEK